MSYPKWLYHADCEPLLVQSHEQHVALGNGWCESPAEIVKDESEPEPEPIKVEIVKRSPGRPKKSKEIVA
jgi:hypothetical protein